MTSPTVFCGGVTKPKDGSHHTGNADSNRVSVNLETIKDVKLRFFFFASKDIRSYDFDEHFGISPHKYIRQNTLGASSVVYECCQ